MKKLFSFFLLTLLFTVGYAADVTIDFSSYGYANGDEVESVTSDDITVTFDKGTNSNNAPKYYTTGEAVRCYGGNFFTVSSSGDNIGEIKLTFGSGSPLVEPLDTAASRRLKSPTPRAATNPA